MHKSTIIMLVGSSALAGSLLTYLAMSMRPSYVMENARRAVGAIGPGKWRWPRLPFLRSRDDAGAQAVAPIPANAAFEEYRSATLLKLESEARDFHNYLERLRFSRDREAFDAFLKQRTERPNADFAN